MKKLFILIASLVLVGSLSAKMEFTKIGQHPELLQSGKEKPWCHICGMSLKMFYKTSHAVVLKDGSKRQYCSIRCLVADWKNIKDSVKEILVVDAKSEKFIPAKKAFYVVGSKVKGTMSKVSKIAFKNEADAKEFAKKFGGKIVSFDEVFEIASKSFASDVKMLKMKKKMMIYPKAKMFYKKMCKEDIDGSRFKTIGELKTFLVKNKPCGDIKGKKLQMLALYIKEAKDSTSSTQKQIIKVPHDAKCPVCGMFVAKYPRWATEVVLDDSKELYFDGCKDMFKYLLSHKVAIKDIFVTDYYNQNEIKAKKAYYVIGSDVLGPMGAELIPFALESDAKVFLKDHRGKKIVSFDEVTKEVMKDFE